MRLGLPAVWIEGIVWFWETTGGTRPTGCTRTECDDLMAHAGATYAFATQVDHRFGNSTGADVAHTVHARGVNDFTAIDLLLPRREATRPVGQRARSGRRSGCPIGTPEGLAPWHGSA